MEQLHRLLVVEAAKELLTTVAPQELPLFVPISRTFLRDPEELRRTYSVTDEIFGFRVIGAEALLAPAVIMLLVECAKQAGTLIVSGANEAAKDSVSAFAGGALRRLFTKSWPPSGKPVAITSEQSRAVWQEVYEKARSMKVGERQSTLLADAVAGSLVTS